MGIKDKISDTVEKISGDNDNDNAATPRRQPDGDPPVPPAQVPESDAPANLDPSAKVEGPRT